MTLALTVVPDAEALAAAVASAIAGAISTAIAERNRAVVAFSGGTTPAAMLRRLSGADLAWSNVAVFQVDERVAPDGSDDRNATMLMRELLDHVPAQSYLMPVTRDRLEDAADSYALLLGDVCGGVLDVVHLGLGADGHTASLVPDDPVLDETAADVALTQEYRGHRRMTMTLPLLNRARAVIWEVAGADKSPALAQLIRGGDIPAARVEQQHATLYADTAAAGDLER